MSPLRHLLCLRHREEYLSLRPWIQRTASVLFRGVPATALTDPPASAIQPSSFGGRYSARDNGDGTFDILDVPIFGEVEKGAKGNAEAIDAPWLAQALAKSRIRFEREGYMPPLHVHHHGDPTTNGKPQRVGFFKLTRVGEVSEGGKAIACLFADLVRVPKHVVEAIARGEFPYRSAEIASVSEGEVASLALLDSDVPFFRFELLTIGRVIPAADYLPEHLGGPHGVAYARVGRGAALCFKFAEDKMPDDEKPEPKGDEKPEEKPAEEKPGEKPAEMKAAKHAEPDGDEAPLGTAPAAMAWIKSALQAIARACGVNIDAQAGNPGDPNPGEQPAPFRPDDDTKTEEMKAKDGGDEPKSDEEMNMSNAPAKTDAIKGTIDPETAGTITAMRAEIEALKAKNAEAEKAAALTARIAKARTELAGIVLGDEDEKSLQFFAAQGDEPLAKFIGAVKRGSPQRPTGDVDSLIGTRSNEVAGDEAIVSKFNAAPADFTAAKDAIQRYRRLERLGHRPPMPADRFVAAAVAAPHLFPARDVE